MRVAVGARTEPFMRMRLALGDGVGGVVVANRAAGRGARLRRATVRRRPTRVSDAILGEGIGSMLCCPMLTGEKVVGALYVGSRRPREFRPIEVALTSALAAQGAVAIENGRLYEALAEQNRVLEGSFAVHRTLTDAALTGAGRAHICAELARLLDAEVVLEQDISPPFRARFGRRARCPTRASTIRHPGRGPRRASRSRPRRRSPRCRRRRSSTPPPCSRWSWSRSARSSRSSGSCRATC